jgi:hypothetical protein
MRFIEKTGLLLAVSFLTAGMAAGQFGGGGPHISGLWNPKVGAGGVYQIDSNGQKSEMTFAVVGKESVGGKDGYWVEMTMQGRQGQGIITKTLMVFGEGSADLARVIIQMPGRPPMEMSTAMMHGKSASSAPSDIRHSGQDLGSESVTTPAGTFACEHYRSSDGGDVWVSKNVSPYGLVKTVSKTSTMILTSVLNDAQDKITGTPQPFDPMKMIPGQQPH